MINPSFDISLSLLNKIDGEGTYWEWLLYTDMRNGDLIASGEAGTLELATSAIAAKIRELHDDVK
jgi:hypothetical protein